MAAPPALSKPRTEASETDLMAGVAARLACQKHVMIISTARDAADLLVPLFDSCEREKVVAAHLDGEKRLIRMVEEEGAADAVDLPVRAIIAEALRLGAAGLIVAHNHPSGDPTPSYADLAATRELAATAARLGIQFHDHLIVGRDGDCRSFRALGLL